MTLNYVRSNSLVREMVPNSQSFEAVQSSSVKLLSQLPPKQLRYSLPCLSRLCFCTPSDLSSPFSGAIQEIRKLIYAVKATGNLISLMSVDFQTIHEDLMKEKAMLRKLNENGHSGKKSNNSSKVYEGGILLEFERSDPTSRIRLVVSELLRLFSEIEGSDGQFSQEYSGLFECDVYLNELNDVLCIALAEMPSLLPIPLLTSVLVRINHGAVLLCRLTLNFPTIFEKVCRCIIDSCRRVMNETETKMKEEALILLCHMNPLYAKTLRGDLVTACCLPGLTVILSSNQQLTQEPPDNNHDLVAFVSGLLFTDNDKSREWFAGFLKQSLSHGAEAMSVFRQQLKADLINLTKRLGNENSPTNADIFDAIALLRLYCGLRGIGYKINGDEADLLLNLVTCHPPVSSVGSRFVIVGLCTVLVCTSLVSSQPREERLTLWLEWLCKNKDVFCKSNSGMTSFGEMLLLIAIHFHSNNLEAIGQLVSTCLNIKLRPGSLTKIKILFTQHLFPEKVVAEHALTVQVTNDLSANMDGYLPIHCVHQLLKSRSFTKHCVSIKGWIYQQLCCTVSPLHSLLVPLVDAFVHSIVMPLGGHKSSGRHSGSKPVALEGFSEEELLNIFKQNSNQEDLTSHLLFMYYTLLYQDTIFRNVRSLGTSNDGPRHYSAALYQAIPIKYLLLKAKTDQISYGLLYPPLLRLVTTHYPHVCQVDDWVAEDELSKDTTMFSLMSHTINHSLESVEEMKKALSADVFNPASTMIHLSMLSQLSPSDLVTYMPVVVSMFPLLLNSEMPRAIQLQCCRLWRQLNAVAPNRLWCDTVNILCQCKNDGLATSVKMQPFTDEEITKDPSIVLRCDEKVFRCPPVFDVLLTILTSYLAASRAFMQQHLLLNPNTIGSLPSQFVDQEREELKNTLIAAQESAIAQMLLEICTTNDSDQPSSGQGLVDYTKREIRCRVCSYLHQVFISDPNMIKLIHFQGYPPELIEMTVAGIPSMHICLDFIPELLNMPQIKKQVFAVQLFSSLAVQYPLPKAQSIAKYTVSRFSTLVSALSTDRMVEFFTPTTPCLVMICKAFPPLKPQCIEALTKLGQIISSCLHIHSGDAAHPGIIFKQSENSDQGFEDTLATSESISKPTKQSDIIPGGDSKNAELYRIIESVLLDISRLNKED